MQGDSFRGDSEDPAAGEGVEYYEMSDIDEEESGSSREDDIPVSSFFLSEIVSRIFNRPHRQNQRTVPVIIAAPLLVASTYVMTMPHGFNSKYVRIAPMMVLVLTPLLA